MHMIHIPKPTQHFPYQRIIDLDSGLIYDYIAAQDDKPAKVIITSLHAGASETSYKINGPDTLGLWAYLLNLCAARIETKPDTYLSQELPHA